MAVTQRIVRTLVAGEVVQNIFDGANYQFIGSQPARVQIWAIQDPASDVELEVRFTTLQILQPSLLNVSTAANLGPNMRDDKIVDETAPPGSQLIGRVRNTDAANPSTFRLLIAVG